MTKPKKQKKTTKKANIADTKKGGFKVSLRNILRLIYSRKRLTLLLLVLGFSIFLAARIQYKDWKNANELRSLTKDFPALVSEIEKATGIKMTVTKGCFESQVKYGGGSRSCGFTGKGEKSPQAVVLNAVDDSDFSVVDFREESNAWIIKHGKFGEECVLAIDPKIYIDCSISVRDDNLELSSELYFEK